MIHLRFASFTACLALFPALLSACSSDSDDGSNTGGSAGTMAAAGMPPGSGGAGASSGGTGTAGNSTAGSGMGGASGGSGNDGPAGAGPTDSTQATVVAYLTAETYKQAPWISETAAPREKSSDVSPHGRVRVWMNDRLLASFAAGNGEFMGTGHDTWSMVVKEFYDDADVYLGRAAMLKESGANNNYVFYCESTDESRCGIEEPLPFYGDSGAACNGCHGGLIYTHPPM